MNTTSTIQSNSEKPEDKLLAKDRKFEKPPISEGPDGHKRPQIRLDVKEFDALRLKGYIENCFLLRETKEEMDESREAIRERRRQFKSVFEAGLKRGSS